MKKILTMGWLSCLVLLASAKDLVFENSVMRFVLGEDARAKSLTLKATGEELLDNHEGLAFFTVTQDRPFNNEIKLANPNKRMTYSAKSVREENGRLIVGFQTAPYEAAVKVRVGAGYLAFELVDFITTDASYPLTPAIKQQLDVDIPPAVAFRAVQLPVKNRRNLGDWLNVVWDERGAVAVVGADPYADIDHEPRYGFEILRGDLLKGFRLRGGAVAIVAGAGREPFLDSMDALEADFQLPRGVKSRRSPKINRSIYFAETPVTLDSVDEHIALAKECGLEMMLISQGNFFNSRGYNYMGDYDWRPAFPEQERTAAKVVAKIKAAGITPGFHTLQTHIGVRSRYVTPRLDPRLGKTRYFTLAKALPKAGEVKEIEVFENPTDAAMYKTCRVLGFGGEAFYYESYTTQPPYRFLGVKRGHWKTEAAAHPVGEIGGTMHVSEFLAQSVYIDQRTDLQDEIAEKIAQLANTGMEFCYLDGSEGVAPPCGVNVALAQYRVASKFKQMPLFTEGAAKSHFSWHLQAGANAFDSFPPESFKRSIAEFPQAEAPIMQKDFTRVDFGWWRVKRPGEKATFLENGVFKSAPSIGTQYDMFEFGESRSVAWDCPAAIDLTPKLRNYPRFADLTKVLRRWEDVRRRELLTPEWRAMLRSPTQEHHLYERSPGEYELYPIEMLTADRAGLRAFLFERQGKRVIAYWHTCDQGEFDLGPVGKLQAENLRYLETTLSADEIRRAFAAYR